MLAIDYPDAHGLLYDPQNDVIFAVGTNLLKAYSVSLADDGTPVVTEATEFAATIPTGSAHDLQPVYGDTDRLWISTGSAVYQYSKSQKKFFTDYEGNGSINKKSVKAIGNYPRQGFPELDLGVRDALHKGRKQIQRGKTEFG